MWGPPPHGYGIPVDADPTFHCHPQSWARVITCSKLFLLPLPPCNRRSCTRRRWACVACCCTRHVGPSRSSPSCCPACASTATSCPRACRCVTSSIPLRLYAIHLASPVYQTERPTASLHSIRPQHTARCEPYTSLPPVSHGLPFSPSPPLRRSTRRARGSRSSGHRGARTSWRSTWMPWCRSTRTPAWTGPATSPELPHATPWPSSSPRWSDRPCCPTSTPSDTPSPTASRYTALAFL